MKKEVLFKRLEEMILPSELQKEDSELKHSQRQDKWKHCDNIRKNVMIVVGIPAIDKDYNDDDLRMEMPFLFEDVDNSMIMHTLAMMCDLNRYVKTKSFTNSKYSMVYALKKELVSALLKHTNIIQYEMMHYKFEADPVNPEYYAVFGYDDQNGQHIRIHQPLNNVKKFFTDDELTAEKENATEFVNDHQEDVFEHTDRELMLYTKKLSSLYLYTKAVHRSFK